MTLADRLFATFDRLYVINLAARDDRRREMAGELARLGLGFDHTRVRLFEAIRPGDAGPFRTIGARGAFLSQLGVLTEARRDGLRAILMLEDDCDFVASATERLPGLLDQLDAIEADVPAVAGRLDHSRVAVIGHSMGGQTAGLLLGARLTDPNDPAAQDVDLREPRIAAGVMLTAPGNGGASLSAMAASNYSFFNPDFSHLSTPTLVVVGDEDASPHLTVRGPAWHADAFHDGPGAEALLTMVGGKHGLGGIAGYDARETDDEDPERLEIALRMTWAYLRSALYAGDDAWQRAKEALAAHGAGRAHVESK